MSTREAALQAPESIARTFRLARRKEATAAFWALIAFTIVLFVAPQNVVPGLHVLMLGKTTAIVALLAYFANRSTTAQPLTITPPAVRWMFLLVAVAVLTIPISFWPGGSINVLTDLFGKSLVIFLLIANVVRTEDRVRTLISVMILAGMLAALVAISNFGSGTLDQQGMRVLGYDSPLALNPNDLALTLNMLLGLAIGLYGVLLKPGNRFLLAGMALLISGVVVSFSRSGFVTLLAVLAVWFARSLRRRGAGVLVLMIPVVAAAFLMLPSGYSDRLATITDTAADPTGSASERIETMKAAVVLFVQHPLTGVGLGNNIHVNVARGWVHNDAHNAYLKLAAELGIVALVAYLMFIVSVFRAVRAARRRFGQQPETRTLASLAYGVELALIAFVVGAFFSPVPYHFYLYYPAGLAVALAAMARALPRPAGTRGGAR
jgi:O-antigen ligase